MAHLTSFLSSDNSGLCHEPRPQTVTSTPTGAPTALPRTVTGTMADEPAALPRVESHLTGVGGSGQTVDDVEAYFGVTG